MRYRSIDDLRVKCGSAAADQAARKLGGATADKSSTVATPAPKPRMNLDRIAELALAVETQSEANTREHWTRKASRAAHHRRLAHETLNAWYLARTGRRLKPPCTVTITRISPRPLDDDNLARAMKAVRDGLADSLRIDDRNPAVKWRYDQRREGNLKAVRVRIETT